MFPTSAGAGVLRGERGRGIVSGFAGRGGRKCSAWCGVDVPDKARSEIKIEGDAVELTGLRGRKHRANSANSLGCKGGEGEST